MVQFLSRNWWLIALRGVLAIFFGVLAFAWPAITWLTLVFIFGVYAIVDGLVAVFTGLSRIKTSRWGVFVVEGVLTIAAGAVALIWPGLTTVVLIYMLAGWAVITGILEIAAAVRLRDEISNEWVLGLGGFVSMVLGILLFLQPAAGSLAIIWIIAGYALIFGVLLVILGFRLRSWRGSNPRPPIPSV
jgi:uncharacterized membrane protein HdeD (DUF308 family)